MSMNNRKKVIRLGTRRSRLAMEQTRMVVEAIRAAAPEMETEIVPMVTTGDRILGKSLVEFGGKGAFISEFEEALKAGDIDAAVHSAKDMPAVLPEGLCVPAVLKRGDPRDVLVTVKGREFPKETVVIGTGSPRRQIQIQERMPAECRLLRGNVPTRLEKLYAGEYDGIILAAAGLERLGLLTDERFSFKYLPEREFIPSGGQGTVAIEARTDSIFTELFRNISHGPSETALAAERRVLRLLEAGCGEAVGVYSWEENGIFTIRLMKEKEGRPVRWEVSGKPQEAMALAEKLAGLYWKER